MGKNKPYIRFHLRIFWSVATFFVLLTFIFIFFQYSREKQYKIELLNIRLTEHNNTIYRTMQEGLPLDSITKETPYRTTLMDLSGNVLYDSEAKPTDSLENHANRKEVLNALKNGMGYDVRRKSHTTGEIYFYSANKYEDCIIRSALPYSAHLKISLKADLQFIYIAVLLLLVMGVIFYTVMKHLGESIERLNDFAMKAKQDEIIEYPTHFPNSELGDISLHIVQIYNRLTTMKKDLLKEKQQVVAQEEEKNAIKQQLTQNIAHELKTPVSSIQGYLETIINNKDLPREILDDFIMKSYLQSTRLAALLYDIAHLTRIDEAPGLIQKEQLDISELIRQIISDVSLQLKEKEMTVINKIEGYTLPCYASLSLLYSIFRNLFDNTIAYAGCGINIEIELCREDEQMYYFSYSDTGVGIDEIHLARIFERFYRVDKGRSRKVGGTGLGLSVVKHAVLFHNGEITAQSGPNGGLSFLFSIKKT
ncbi:MAG: histidine kinase [Bacteroidales bacterium]|jgi:signal transduction histidine kinase|nr:histidine kinase [Bacteroidales bacterium]